MSSKIEEMAGAHVVEYPDATRSSIPIERVYELERVAFRQGAQALLEEARKMAFTAKVGDGIFPAVGIDSLEALFADGKKG